MGLIELEKKGTVTINGMSTDEQVAHMGTLGEDNLGSLNLAPTNYEFKQPVIQDQGMNKGRVKREVGIFSVCLSTALILLFIIGFTTLAGYIAMKVTNYDFMIFPKMESYDLSQYNACVRRTFLILAGMLIGTCFIVLFIINMVVKSRFRNNFICKVNIFIYSVFAIATNVIIYLGVIMLYFFEVNRISKHIKGLLDSGVITEKVNTGVLDGFKYAIIIVAIIFMVINCFNIFSIVKEKNKFVIEEEM